MKQTNRPLEIIGVDSTAEKMDVMVSGKTFCARTDKQLPAHDAMPYSTFPH